MTPLQIRNLITMLLALLGAVACFAYVFTRQRRKAKKPVYMIAGFGFLYAVLSYSLGVFPNPPAFLLSLLYSGWLGAISYYLIVLSYIAIIITDWRRDERG